MLGAAENDEIVWIVVQRIAVDVVNQLVRLIDDQLRSAT